MSALLPFVVHELLKYKESSVNATRAFESLQHNNDLCPALEKQGNRILDCFIKYQSITYDVQGITDRGTDVLLKYYIESDDQERLSRYIAFQIKSFSDLNEPNYLRDLKAQYADSLAAFGGRLDHYYILLCTNKLVHQNKIRQIKSAFSTTIGVTVIDPTYAHTFLHLSQFRISSAVSSLLRVGDIIYEKALNILMDFTPLEIAVFLCIVHETMILGNKSVDLEAIVNKTFISDILRQVPDYPRDYFFYDDSDEATADQARDAQSRLAEAVDALEGNLFSYDGDTFEVLINSYYAMPVQVLLLEAIIRYEYQEDLLLRYLFDTLEIFEAFELEISEEE